MPFQPPRGFKRDLREGKPKFGVLCGTSSVQIAELSAFIGVDYLLVDLEHGDGLDVAAAAPLIRAADVAGVPVIVRVPRNGPDAIQRVLDHGALGVCIPHVRTRADVERAVSYARYAPDGERAMSSLVRSARFAGGPEWNSYWRTANEEVVVMAIVEDREGLENLEEIAAVPGLDVLWIGAGDLSQSLGVPGEGGHPLIVEAQRRGAELARRQGIFSFLPVQSSLAADGDSRRAQIEQGLQSGHMMFAWVDTMVYGAALEELVSVARAVSQSPLRSA